MAKVKQELTDLVVEQNILNKIFIIRGEKGMFDGDLAKLYGVETKVFNQSVRRHVERFHVFSQRQRRAKPEV